MPGFAAYVVAAHIASDMQFEARQLMQADDDGMVERFIPLEGVKEPVGLSWAQMRALRNDTVKFIETLWPGWMQDWQKDLVSRMDSEEWRRQYVSDWEPPAMCKCGPRRLASVSRPHRIYGKRYFGYHTCGLPINGEERYS